MTTEQVSETAPAKINLCLHVTGRRSDGYHLLDSLVVFAATSDQISVATAKGLSLAISGPEAAGLEGGPENLVLRAAVAMGVPDVSVHLAKALPVASGIGGGSADAAATLRALAQLTGRALPAPATVLALGADVPVCLAGEPARMRGVGEDLQPLPPLPPLWLVLANPRIAVPTAAVFGRLEQRENPPVPDLPAAGWRDAGDLAAWLEDQTRNDLYPPARLIAPGIEGVLAALATSPGCLMSRMSGSGATCFGIFATAEGAAAAARAIRGDHPDWWVADSGLADQK